MTTSSVLSAETVFLKDGTIIKGKISEEDDRLIKVTLPDGVKKTIRRRDHLRTIYTDVYMGRVKIKKRDGGEFEAFIVDEDRDSYLFRWNLSKAEEFRLKRSEIFQISRLEPSSLKAEILKDRINLTWEPPFSKIKEYKVYTRSGNDKYMLAAVSKNEKCTIFGLKEKISYSIIVRAVDINGSESEPSNELLIVLTDLKPGQPTGLKCETLDSGDGSSLTAALKWDKDETGKKVTYRIYKITPENETLAGETTENEYMIYALPSESIHSFFVTAVDKGGTVSDRSIIVYTKGSIQDQFTTGISLLMPFGRLGEICSAGYGIKFSYTAENAFTNYLRISANAGINYFLTEYKMFNYIFILPVTFNFGYSFYITPELSLIPEIGGGLSYNIISYDSGYKSASDVAEYSNSTSIRPAADSSLSLSWRAFTDFGILFQLEYMIIKDSSIYHYASATAAATYRF
jgi:hypothetical protein